MNNNEFNLTNDESARIKDIFCDIQYDPSGGVDYISKIRKAAYESFPSWLLNILENQKCSLKPLGSFIINNFMIDDNVTGSPLSNETGLKYKSGTISENVITAIGAMVGEPYSIKFEGHELVNNLSPHKSASKDYTGIGYEVELDFHTENAALRFINEDSYSPMSMALLGVRTDVDSEGPKTYISDARKAIKLLSKDDIDALYGDNYIFKLPYRLRGDLMLMPQNPHQ